jgi:transcriptional regulator with XRE-family HTH domain
VRSTPIKEHSQYAQQRYERNSSAYGGFLGVVCASIGGVDDSGVDPSLGRSIMSARIEQGMKRAELAERSGLSYTFLSEIERGVKRASEKSLYLIAEALDTSPFELQARAEALRARGADSSMRMATPMASRPMPAMLRASAGRRAAAEDSRGPEDRLVDRVMGVVAAELNRFLVEELEPLIRQEVRSHLWTRDERHGL